MSRSRRGPLSLADQLLAVGAGVAAGLVTMYLARIWFAREELPHRSRTPAPSGRRPAPDRQAGGPADEDR
jgi:hypothetical protein